MRAWAVQDAKARFSELLDMCIDNGPQIVTRRGTEAAMLVPIAEWKRLNNAARPSLKTLLLSNTDRLDLAPLKRNSVKRRAIPAATDFD